MRPYIVSGIVFVIALVLCLLAWISIRGVLQYRATYSGSVTFIGRASGALGTEYYRVYMWRDPSDRSPLPDVTVYLKGTPYRLSELTAELMASLGGTIPEGGVKDSADYDFQYRFSDGYLTYMAIYPPHPALAPAPETPQADRFYIQLDEGPPFLFPVSQRQLIEYAGKPLDLSHDLAN